MILTLPDLRQGPNDATCGRVCAHVVWDYFGVQWRPDLANKIEERKVPGNPIDGTHPDTLETVMWEAGLNVQAGCMDLHDLRHHTKKGRAVICPTTEDDGVGHYVVVAGFTRRKSGGKTVPHVRYHDPLEGPMDEPAEAFEARWVDRTRRGVKYLRWGIAVGS